MADKRITDVDFLDSLDSDESFFVNRNNSLKQINKSNIVFGISNGGTGATTVEEARANLGVTRENLGAAAIDNGVQTYTHSNTVLTGTGTNGRVKATSNDTYSNFIINGNTYAVKQGGENEIEFINGAWYSFILDVEDYTINFKIGGAKLNYSIVGSTTEPENPKENMIWVNTDVPITRHDFGDVEPARVSSNRNLNIYPYKDRNPNNKDLLITSSNGITYKDVEDGTIQVSGSLSSSATESVFVCNENIYLKNGTYTISGNVIGDDSANIAVRLIYSYDEFATAQTVDSIIEPISVALIDDAVANICIVVNKSLTSSNIVKPQLEAGNVATEFIKGNALGQVWIMTGKEDAKTSFSIFKNKSKNNTRIYPVSIVQFNNRWIVKDSKIYKNGEWVALDSFMFLNGIRNLDIPVTLTLSNTSSEYYYNYSISDSGEYIIEARQLKSTSSITGERPSFAYIDVTDLKKIKVRIRKCIRGVGATSEGDIMAFTLLKSDGSGSIVGKLDGYADMNTNDLNRFNQSVLDVSNATIPCYFRLFMELKDKGLNSDNVIYIDNILLEYI